MNASDFLPVEFNVASWFVDRPVAEGRGAAPAFHCEDRVLTYADLQELVDRTGNALRELGVEPEQRVVWSASTRPSSSARSGARSRSARCPVPVNTLLRAPDYRYFLDDSRARVAVVSAAAPRRGGAGAREARRTSGTCWWRAARRARTSRSRSGRARRPRGSRRRHLATTSRSGSTPRARPASRRAPSTSSTTWWSAADTYARAGARHPADRQGLLGRQALLRLRPRQRHVLPDERGRARACSIPGRPTPDGVFEPDPPPPPDASSSACRRSTPRCSPQGRGDALDLSCVRASACRRARRCRRSSTSAGASASGVEILDGIGTTEMLPHLPVQPARAPRGPGSTGLAGAGLRVRASSTTRASPCRRGEIGNLRVRGDSTMAVLLEPAREDQGRRSSATGSRPATSTTRTRTATSGTAGAATTCSRSAASGSRRSRSRRR